MPSIHAKYKHLDGDIFCYSTDLTKWYYRVYIKDQRKYKYKLIPNATDVVSALQNVGHLELDTPTVTVSLQHHIDSYIKHEEQRHSINYITINTLTRKKQFIKRLTVYCKEFKLDNVEDIKRNSFDQWSLHFQIKSKLSLQVDYRHIRHWLNYLVHNDVIAVDPVILPKVLIRDEDLSSNPPISDKDWKLILRHINKWEEQAKGRSNYRHHWWRYIFRHFVHVAKRSGLRPNELCDLRWCDVEVIDSPSSIQEDSIATLRVRKSKTHSARVVPTNMGRELRRLRSYQEDYLDKYRPRVINSTDYIFTDINGKQYKVADYSRCWRTFVVGLIREQLEGDKDYGRNYTLYSLRSSYINDQLRKGVDVFLLAKACGHSVKTLMKYYERFDVTSREDELATLPIGKTKEAVKGRVSL